MTEVENELTYNSLFATVANLIFFTLHPILFPICVRVTANVTAPCITRVLKKKYIEWDDNFNLNHLMTYFFLRDGNCNFAKLPLFWGEGAIIYVGDN